MSERALSWRDQPVDRITVDIVVPVLNEGRILERSIRTLHRFLDEHLAYQWTIVIAENGSSDDTVDVGRQICSQMERVRLIVLPTAGRGRALRAAWSESHADVVGYTDVDLSTELAGFARLLDAVILERYDIAVGSRRLPGSRITRSWHRRVLSSGYNRLLQLALHVGFTDAQTGFKVMTREVVRTVLPHVQDQSWFFDTELLVLAERMNYRVADLPVAWVEDADSRVRIVRTIVDDLLGIARLRRSRREGPRA